MNHRDIIESQIDLLVKLNQELTKQQATPELAREIRENALAILRLTEIESTIRTQEILDDLEERLAALEETIFGDEDIEKIGTGYRQATLVRCIKDCREDLDTIYDVWGPALERHLGPDWGDEVDEAGE